MSGVAEGYSHTHRCKRCHFETYDYEALCVVCGWDQWNDSHEHTWWGSWVELTGWFERHGFTRGDDL